MIASLNDVGGDHSFRQILLLLGGHSYKSMPIIDCAVSGVSVIIPSISNFSISFKLCRPFTVHTQTSRPAA